MPSGDLDDFEPVLKPEMVSLPSEHRQPASGSRLAIFHHPFAVTQVYELGNVSTDALELARGSRSVQSKFGLDLKLRDDLRVLHLQQFTVTSDLELAVEPESLDLHRDVAEF